jgi:type IV pilus assembly protein PilM
MAIRSYKKILKQNKSPAYRGRFSPIGLDIGSDRIKLLQLTRSGGAAAIYRQALFPAPAGGPGCDPAALSETLKEIFRQARFRHNRVQLSIHSQAVTLRRISLPPLSPPEITRAMRWEAQKTLPFPPEEAVFDYAFVDSRTEQGKTVLDFVLAAVPKAVAEDYTGAAARAGLYPEAVEIAPLALRRAVEWCGATGPPPLRETLLVVEVGAESSDLLVLHRGRYRFYRPINLGVNHFCQEAFPGQPAGDRSRQRLCSAEPLSERGLAGTALNLARQIARSLEFYAYETEYPEKQCRGALLCGGGAMIQGLESFLTGELGIQTARFDPLVPPYFKAGGGPETAEGPLFATALGLALRGWAR